MISDKVGLPRNTRDARVLAHVSMHRFFSVAVFNTRSLAYEARYVAQCQLSTAALDSLQSGADQPAFVRSHFRVVIAHAQCTAYSAGLTKIIIR